MDDRHPRYEVDRRERSCGSCKKIDEIERENLPMIGNQHALSLLEEFLEGHVDPNYHTWEGDCRYTTPEGYTVDELLELPYETDLTARPGRLDIEVEFQRLNYLREIEVTIEC